jgi:glycosyltransferase involved in cell wall biosynthesis
MNPKNLSIVTGTLNRRKFLPDIIENTVNRDERLELVLVDGGSTDGTIKYVKSLNHPRIKLVEVGHRSSYPHFMNLGVRNASHEYVCQWNDDVFMTNDWNDVFDELDDTEVYIFAWKVDNYPRFSKKGWIIHNTIGSDNSGQIVMNFGIYQKSVFRKIGLYNPAYSFYCADGDMSHRAWCHGCKVRCLPNIRVVSRKRISKSRKYDASEDLRLYEKFLAMDRQKQLPDDLEYL